MKPIIFSAPMVRALLDGTKTQTRRVCVDQTALSYQWVVNVPVIPTNANRPYIGWAKDCGHSFLLPTKCPYGAVGDRLWVRETFAGPAHFGEEGRTAYGYCYRADDSIVQSGDCGCEGPCGGVRVVHPWRPSIFMPRWASRITLEITDVRVQRVQDINGYDAMHEGVDLDGGRAGYDVDIDGCFSDRFLIERYAALWDSINAKRAPWASNPWVWVIAFKRVAA